MAREASYSAFGRLIGVSQPAVSKAVASGRITAAVLGTDAKGRPVIVDVEGARREWEANASKPTKPRPRRKGPTLADAQRSVAIERAKRLEFDNAVRRGHYVPLEEAKREAFES